MPRFLSPSARPLPAPSFRSYAATVSVAGAATIIAVALVAPAAWHPGVLLLAVLVLVGELLPIDVPRRQGLDRITTSTAFAFAIALLFGPLPAVVAYAGASLIADGLARLGWLKVAVQRRAVRARARGGGRDDAGARRAAAGRVAG